MSLTESQCKHLRRLGHDLKPTVLVGAGGLTDGVVAEVDSSLAHHELIKIRVRSGDRKQRDAVISEIVARTAAYRRVCTYHRMNLRWDVRAAHRWHV